MKFKCKTIIKKKKEEWPVKINYLKKHKDCYEIFIESRSSIMVIFGETTRGKFACMPDFGVGCHLVDLKDTFWNTERLVSVLGKVDGATVSSALYYLHKKSYLNRNGEHPNVQ
jgi:hypothetical protein